VSVAIDDGATLVAPKLAPKRLLAYWDSIGEGAYINGKLTWQWAHDAHLTWAFSLALGLNAELSLVAFSGQGYTKGGAGKSPQLWSSSGLPTESSWSWISSNRKRTFENCPDYIINGHGTNDRRNDQNLVFTNSLGWLKDMRKTCPTSRIFLTVPFGRFCEATLVNVYQTYQASTPDPLTHLIQMGEQGSPGLQGGGPSLAACDGIHPWAWKSSQLGALLAAKISPLLNSHQYYLEI
jgi:lysophospholipase L1-like esterase